MSRTVCVLACLAVFTLSAGPVSAQTLFQVGDLVMSIDADADTACLTQEDLERFSSARETCMQGDPEGCQVTKDLEAKNACGFHHYDYVVLSIDTQSGFMQISPAADRSTVYWADVRDFKPEE